MAHSSELLVRPHSKPRYKEWNQTGAVVSLLRENWDSIFKATETVGIYGARYHRDKGCTEKKLQASNYRVPLLLWPNTKLDVQWERIYKPPEGYKQGADFGAHMVSEILAFHPTGVKWPSEGNHDSAETLQKSCLKSKIYAL